MKKKVYITTFQNAYNYGAILQCFALQEILKQMGYDVFVINYDNKNISDPYHLVVNKEENIYLQIKTIISRFLYRKKLKLRNQNFDKFISDKLNLTKLLSREEIINYGFDENDVIITGSDQVWNTNLVKGIDSIYFLDFNTSAKKISYAASIGTSKIDKKYKRNFVSVLNKYDSISVREETAKKILNNIINKEIDVSLDPTLLVDKDSWCKYIPKERLIKEKYLFVYMPSKKVEKIALEIAREKKLKIVNVSKKNIFGKYEINGFHYNPFEFIQLIRDSEYVVTSSFHATVFSIIFNKKFLVSPPNGLNSRIVDLLNLLKLSDRIITEISNESLKLIDNKINFNEAKMILTNEQKKSLNYLKDNI